MTDLQLKCAHCGKIRGNHLANTYACPVGHKTRIGYICFHATNRFEPKPAKKLPTEGSRPGRPRELRR